MPRSGGVFSLVASYFATSGQSIRTEQHNPVLEDIAQAITGSVARDGSTPMLGDLAMGGRKITGLGNGTASTDAAAFGQIPSAASLTALAPPGMYGLFFTPSAPAGWLKANGVAVSRTTYAALWVAMGSPNTGDGSTTFNLPDMRAEFARGLDEGRGVDVGRVLGSAQDAAMLNHSHTGTTSSDGAHTHTPSGGGSFIAGNAGPNDGFDDGGLYTSTNSSAMTTAPNHTHTLTTGNPSSGGGNETRPRNVALLACIKI